MLLEPVSFTQNDLAKYPFLKETARHLKKLDLSIQDLANPEMGQILKRAVKRIEDSILRVSTGYRVENDIEIPSFPVALLLVTATENKFIKKRYALAEAKQALSNLQLESPEKIVAIGHDFEWDITFNQIRGIPFEFAVSFADYLRNTTHLREKEWKLVNRIMVKGKVYLNKHDAARLLQEEIQRRVEKRLEAAGQPKFPQEILDIAERMKKLAAEKLGTMEQETFPKVVVKEAFPPCVNELYNAASSGRHLSHIGRFTLTSFLVNIGMPSEKVTELFKSFSDYNERLTQYQVEHIAGDRGSGTKYTSPKCETLQTHGVCNNPDALCHRVHHPLSYYKRKQKR
jgi:DNA primase large subunit